MGGCASLRTRAARSQAVPMSLASSTTRCRRASKRVSAPENENARIKPTTKVEFGGRRTRMSGDPLRDLDCAARIHVLGNTRRTEAVTTNSFLVSADCQTQPLLEPKTAPRICQQAGPCGISNVLKVNLQKTIHTLRDRGWSRRPGDVSPASLGLIERRSAAFAFTKTRHFNLRQKCWAKESM